MSALSVSCTLQCNGTAGSFQLGEALSAAAEARCLRSAKSKDTGNVSSSEPPVGYRTTRFFHVGEAISTAAEARWLRRGLSF